MHEPCAYSAVVYHTTTRSQKTFHLANAYTLRRNPHNGKSTYMSLRNAFHGKAFVIEFTMKNWNRCAHLWRLQGYQFAKEHAI